ncbi:hypothetical protein [Nocardia rhizosphaerae]|uniref:Uncharacterized protein n=1 Tax=Nocardia rhizosphaerae TaxID=1691571 RepID=A0ABV8LC16_9NOCA
MTAGVHAFDDYALEYQITRPRPARDALAEVLRPLDHVATRVRVRIEPWRASTATPTTFPVDELVGPLRDHCLDPLVSQQRSIRRRGIRLVGQDTLGFRRGGPPTSLGAAIASSTSGNIGESPVWPAVINTARPRPLPSVAK